jgi:hypothetical protein
VQQILALSRTAVVTRHWFEINLDDASMEHGSRIEIRELTEQRHRGSESAAQLITADRPLWRADLFDRLADQPGSFGAAHYHPEFQGHEPCPRVWDPELTAAPWDWLANQLTQLGDAPRMGAFQLDAEDARELSRQATAIVTSARQFSPDRCTSTAECFRLTRDAKERVQLMIGSLRQPWLLDTERAAPWQAGKQA